MALGNRAFSLLVLLLPIAGCGGDETTGATAGGVSGGSASGSQLPTNGDAATSGGAGAQLGSTGSTGGAGGSGRSGTSGHGGALPDGGGSTSGVGNTDASATRDSGGSRDGAVDTSSGPDAKDGGAVVLDVGGQPDSGVQLNPNITVDTETRYQTIDGFGSALPMWGGANGMWTTDEVHKFVGLGDSELGTTIVRTIIDPDASRWSLAVSDLKEAKAYGKDVKILATPWSPPANMKDNGTTVNGGALLPARYGDYAKHLSSYIAYMNQQGVSIDVVSVQNEPDWKTDYESCIWSGEQFRTFVRDHGASITGAKLMIAESLGFNRKYTDPTLNDATAANNIAYIGGHLYGAEASGNLSPYPLAEQKGKNRWMTEWNLHEADGKGAAIWGGDNKAVWDESLDEVIRSVHAAMEARWSAYIWWWGRRYYSFVGDGDAAYGTTKGAILKRGWAFSQFSRFVRPGYVRVGAKMNTTYESLYLTAYEGDHHIVVVLLNRSTQDYKNVVFKVPHLVTSAEAYVTSQSANRQPVVATPTGQYATVADLAPRSVVTVVMSY